jgi:hypothetical protein
MQTPAPILTPGRGLYCFEKAPSQGGNSLIGDWLLKKVNVLNKATEVWHTFSLRNENTRYDIACCIQAS